MSNLKVNVAGVDFKNPVILASGCCGYGMEYGRFFPPEAVGGMSLKGTTLEPRMGNATPRVAETPMGMLNSVGLQNVGIHSFIKDYLPIIRSHDTVVIANVSGAGTDDYVESCTLVDSSSVDMIELNISCPNVKEGGIAFGADPKSAAAIVKAVRAVVKNKPLMVKLTPNVTDITEIAKAVEAEGADAVSLINTLLGMRIDVNKQRPLLANVTGGLSGPAVFPVALRMVWQVYKAVNIPIVGLGGVKTANDAIEMMMAGASAVQMGSALFNDPMSPIKVIDGMSEWLDKKGIASISEIVGAAHG